MPHSCLNMKQVTSLEPLNTVRKAKLPVPNMVKYMRCSPCIPLKKAIKRVHPPHVLPMPVEIAQQTQVVRIPDFLSELEVSDVMDAIERSSLPAYTSNYGEDVDSGGNPVHTTTYLQTEGFFQKRLHWLCERIRRLALEQIKLNGWRFSHRAISMFNVRVAEFHDMYKGGSLPYPEHYDIGSLVTVDIMLQKPDSGAEFQTLERSGIGMDGLDEKSGAVLQSHPFEVGDALVFVSHKYHSVTPLTQGNRKVLVVEFWHGKRRRCGHRCDKPFGVCAFRDNND